MYELFEGFLMILGIVMIYFITKKMYKAGKIEVLLPEADAEPIEEAVQNDK